MYILGSSPHNKRFVPDLTKFAWPELHGWYCILTGNLSDFTLYVTSKTDLLLIKKKCFEILMTFCNYWDVGFLLLTTFNEIK